MPKKGAAKDLQTSETREKMAEALRLRKMGWSLKSIGEALDPPCSGPYVAIMIKKALKEVITEPVEELRKIELERIDDLWIKQFEKAQKGNLGALEACLKLMERRAKYVGIEVPTKVANTDPTGEKEATPATPAVQVYIPSNGR